MDNNNLFGGTEENTTGEVQQNVENTVETPGVDTQSPYASPLAAQPTGTYSSFDVQNNGQYTSNDVQNSSIGQFGSMDVQNGGQGQFGSADMQNSGLGQFSTTDTQDNNMGQYSSAGQYAYEQEINNNSSFGYQNQNGDYTYGSNTNQNGSQSAPNYYANNYNSMNYQNQNSELEEPVKMGEWLLTLVLFAIPCVGLIMAIVWAFGDGEKKSKSNFCKAYLIMMLIGLVVSVLAVIIFGALFLTIFDSVYYLL